MHTTTSYHTHNHYCDGEGSIEEMIEAALAAGLTEIGISSHMPLPFDTAWTMAPARLPAYISDVRTLQERYRGRIRVVLGGEIDFLPGDAVATFQQEHIFPLEFDYLIGSVHFLGPSDLPREIDGREEIFRAILQEEYEGDIQEMVEEYYRRIPGVLSMPRVRIVGHIDRIKRWNADRRYFSGDEPWYVNAVEGALHAIAGTGAILEINTSGWRNGVGEAYPSQSILARCRDLGIPVSISADAHAPDQVTWAFEEAETCLAKLGIAPVRLTD